MVLQARKPVRRQKFRGLSLLWPCKGSAPGLQTRRRGSPRPSLRPQNTRSSLPPGSRSRGTAEVRAWPKRDHGFLLPLPRPHPSLLELGYRFRTGLRLVFCFLFEVILTAYWYLYGSYLPFLRLEIWDVELHLC